MTRLIRRIVVTLVPAATVFSVQAVSSAVVEGATDAKPRIIATTDGEIDDRCSMVRFLLYANEWDIEGIIYCSSKFHSLAYSRKRTIEQRSSISPSVVAMMRGRCSTAVAAG